MKFVAFECNSASRAKKASIVLSEWPAIRFMWCENRLHGGGSHKQLQKNNNWTQELLFNNYKKSILEPKTYYLIKQLSTKWDNTKDM